MGCRSFLCVGRWSLGLDDEIEENLSLLFLFLSFFLALVRWRQSAKCASFKAGGLL